MAVIGTDDAGRRLVFIWKGPTEMPFPFDARGQAWAAGLLLIPVGVIAAWAVTVPVEALPVGQAPASLLHALVAVTLGVLAAIWVIRKVGSYVDPTRPVRHHVTQLVNEVTAHREADTARTTRLVLSPGLWVDDTTTVRIAPAVPDPMDVNPHFTYFPDPDPATTD